MHESPDNLIQSKESIWILPIEMYWAIWRKRIFVATLTSNLTIFLPSGVEMQVKVRFPGIVCFLLTGLTVCGTCQPGMCQESRFYQQGGITFKETRTKVQQPVREIEYQDQQQTWYRERYITDMQPVAQTVYQPTTQYVWEPRWHEWWRPFQGPHLAYHLVPRSAWQPQVLNQQIPVTRREVIPETRTVRVPTQKLSMKEVEQVTRVAVGPAASNAAVAQAPAASAPGLAWNLPTIPQPAAVYVPPTPNYAARNYAAPNYAYVAPNGAANYAYPYGGVARMESDPPRFGSALATLPSEGAWQARRDTGDQTR